MATYKLTIRRGSDVSRDTYERLGDAVKAMEAEADSVAAEGPLPERSMIRTYEPEKQVAARIEISSGGLLGGSTAGVDVMGDGRVVPFKGGIIRHELTPKGGQTPFDAVRKAIR